MASHMASHMVVVSGVGEDSSHRNDVLSASLRDHGVRVGLDRLVLGDGLDRGDQLGSDGRHQAISQLEVTGFHERSVRAAYERVRGRRLQELVLFGAKVLLDRDLERRLRGALARQIRDLHEVGVHGKLVVRT